MEQLSKNDKRLNMRLPASVVAAYEEAAPLMGMSAHQLAREVLAGSVPQLALLVEAFHKVTSGQPVEAMRLVLDDVQKQLDQARKEAEAERVSRLVCEHAFQPSIDRVTMRCTKCGTRYMQVPE